MIALGNKGFSFSFNPLAPSTTIWTVLVVSGPKPRLVASSRAHATAAFRPPNVAQVFLLIGPCSLPSGPRQSVYITTTITSLPFLLLSPFFRRFFLPRLFLFAWPRCRWHLQEQPLGCARFPRRFLNSCSVAVGGHLPSSSITNTLPSSGGAAICCMNGAACRPKPSTKCSIASVEGDHPSTALQIMRLAAKLIRVANRVTSCTTHGENPSRVSPKATSK